MEIAPNLHCIDLGSVNTYLLVEETGLTLIDTGMPRSEGKILAYVRQMGRQAADIQHIILTHADIDHAGSVKALAAATGAQVWAGAQTAALVDQGSSPKHNFWPIDFFGRWWHYGAVPQAQINVVQDGQTVPVWGGLLALYTPGHTPDHLSLISEQAGVVVAGDALNTRGDQLQLTPPAITFDKDAARKSAAKLLSYPATLFACGHGAPLKAPHPSIERLKAAVA